MTDGAISQVSGSASPAALDAMKEGTRKSEDESSTLKAEEPGSKRSSQDAVKVSIQSSPQEE